jgi:glyoxylase-like metal-dependent hydrolase (beta-lactamase superfamily II)
MQVETFTVGYLSTNCYVASSLQTKDAVIIDPGIDYTPEAQIIFDHIAQSRLTVEFIVNTHGHPDHINGNALFQERYKVPVYIHYLDVNSIRGADSKPNLLEDGSQLIFGDEFLKVIHTPGHTPGSICLVGKGLVFSGDTLFAGGIGRTDFPGSSPRDIEISLKKLVGLPDNFLVYPGHGPASTIGEEKKFNPFL